MWRIRGLGRGEPNDRSPITVTVVDETEEEASAARPVSLNQDAQWLVIEFSNHLTHLGPFQAEIF